MTGWILALVRRWRDRPDPALYTTGYRQVYVGHDERLQDAARIRLAKHEESRRKLADSRSKPRAGKIREFPREASR